MGDDAAVGRRRRRAVGPHGAVSGEEPALDLDAPRPEQSGDGDDERLRADRPPHHDRGV